MNVSKSCAKMTKEERVEILRILCGRADMGQPSKIVIGPDPSGVFYGTLRYMAIEDRFHLVIGSEPLLQFNVSDVVSCDRLGTVVHVKKRLEENVSYDAVLLRLEDELGLARQKQSYYRSTGNEQEISRWCKVSGIIEQCINELRMV